MIRWLVPASPRAGPGCSRGRGGGSSRGVPGHAGKPAPAQAVGEENDRFALGFQRVDGLLHAAAEFVRSVVEALFEIRHLGRVAHGSRQAFQLGAEDFAGDEVHIRFLSAGWRGCRGRLGGRSRLAAGSMERRPASLPCSPAAGFPFRLRSIPSIQRGFLRAASPPVKRLGRWKGPGRGGNPSSEGFLLPSPVPIMFFYALAAAQISRAFSAAEEASGCNNRLRWTRGRRH